MARKTRSTQTAGKIAPASARRAPAPVPAGEEDLLRLVAGLLAENDLTELEMERGGLRIRAARAPAAPAIAAAPQFLATPVAASLLPVPTHKPALEPAIEERKALPDHPDAVKSPMVGTAYLRPNPESHAFVEVGSRVSVGDKLLLIEAMKTFNDIVAPKAGVVTAVLVEDGQPVEYGQPLLVIE
jgi:acetyl-CoA carboxylase biotin carboxyl carrier protein